MKDGPPRIGGDLDRVLSLLSRPGSWIDMEASAGGYAVRQSPDRRGRILLRLDETQLAALIANPGLRPRTGGGWTLRSRAEVTPDRSGYPGRLEGQRSVTLKDGTVVLRRANLGQCPLIWLSRRVDAKGRAFLDPSERAAGERLRLDAEQASRGASVTQRWDGLPRRSAGSNVRAEPSTAVLSAARRLALALDAVSPTARPVVQSICLTHHGLQTTETNLDLRRRQARLLLKRGLGELARHYRIG